MWAPPQIVATYVIIFLEEWVWGAGDGVSNGLSAYKCYLVERIIDSSDPGYGVDTQLSQITIMWAKIGKSKFRI